MPHSVTYDAEAGIVAVSIQGEVDPSVIDAVVSETARLAKEYNCFRVLSDCREASVGFSTMDIFDLPKVLAKMLSASGLPINRLRRALVVAGNVADASFFETVSLNQGQNLAVFHDLGEAKKWLLENASAPRLV